MKKLVFNPLSGALDRFPTPKEIGASTKTSYSTTAPSSPVAGDRWVDTTDLREFEYINGTWVEMSAGLIGPQGERGPAGERGPKGDKGDRGLQGPQGVPGATTWDGILDKPVTFPIESHYHEISDIDNLSGQLAAKQPVGNYVELDSTGRVPSSLLPSFVDDVIEVNSFADLTASIGSEGKIYVVKGSYDSGDGTGSRAGRQFRWGGTQYVEIVASPGTTNNVPEGSSNLYFTATRVLGSALTGFAAAATNATLAATDTVLGAFGKVQKQISDAVTSLTSHTTNVNNPHSVTKTQVGLGSVDNTSDLLKPISTATQTALNAKANFQPNPELVADAVANAITSGIHSGLAIKETQSFGTVYNYGGFFSNSGGLALVYNGTMFVPSVANRWALISDDGEGGYGVIAVANETGGAYPWSVTYSNLVVTKQPVPRLVGTALATNASEGTSAYAARADHVHPLPSALQVGAAPLQSGKIPSQYLPSYVDDVVEYVTFSQLLADTSARVSGKIYVIQDTGKIYRWSGGTLFIEISNTLDLANLQIPDSQVGVNLWINGATAGTLSKDATPVNGKNSYSSSSGGDSWSVYYTGTQWRGEHSYSGDGDTSAFMLAAAGNTTYPWQATWSDGSVSRIGSYDATLAPKPLAAEAESGVGTKAAREDHVHPLPTPADIGVPAFSTDSFANTAMLRGHYGQSQATSYLGNDASLKTDSRWLMLNPLDSFSNYFALFFHVVNGTGNGVGGISKVGTTGVAYNTSSDYRLKTNIEPLTAAVSRLLQIPVHRFNWLADPTAPKVDGFLAHEAQAIVPESVTGHKDEVDAEGKPIHQGIDQSKLVPLLVAAVQELAARVAALENK